MAFARLWFVMVGVFRVAADGRLSNTVGLWLPGSPTQSEPFGRVDAFACIFDSHLGERHLA